MLPTRWARRAGGGLHKQQAPDGGSEDKARVLLRCYGCDKPMDAALLQEASRHGDQYSSGFPCHLFFPSRPSLTRSKGPSKGTTHPNDIIVPCGSHQSPVMPWDWGNELPSRSSRSCLSCSLSLFLSRDLSLIRQTTADPPSLSPASVSLVPFATPTHSPTAHRGSDTVVSPDVIVSEHPKQ